MFDFSETKNKSTSSCSWNLKFLISEIIKDVKTEVVLSNWTFHMLMQLPWALYNIHFSYLYSNTQWHV